MRTHRSLSFLLVFAILAVAIGRDTAAQGAAPLLGPAPEAAQAVADAARDALVVRSRAMVASLPLLQTATAAGQAGDRNPLFVLNLFDDVTLPAVFERFETDALGHQTWVGRVAGDVTSTVTLSWRGEVLSGGVQTGDRLFRLTTRQGVTIVDELNADGFPDELPPLPSGEPVPQPLVDANGDIEVADGEIVDIYVFYTAAARTAQGGQAQIEALIAQGVADANTAYARSGVLATLRLVGGGELPGFVETANMTADLGTFRNSPTAQATREAYGADLMHLVLGASSSACGVAYLGPSVNAAYGVTSRDCFFQYTFAHEVGHNFGSHHAPEDGASGAFRTYSYGYKNCAATSRYRTVMAYACSPSPSGTRILNFSSTTVQYNGQPTGTATQDNARSLREAFPIVQVHRTGATPTLPSVPLNLQATAAGNQLTVSWAAPATGVPILTYRVQAGSGPGLSNFFNGDVGAGTAVSAPVPNGTYHLRVAARNAVGFGPATADVAVTVGAAAPGAPQSLNASVVGSRLTVSWAAPLSGGAVSTYVLQAGSASGLANIFNGQVGLTTSIGADVPPGTYYLRAFAQGTGGTSPPSNEAVASVSCPLPAAPVLTASRVGNVISVSWTAVGGATSYTLGAGSSTGASNFFNASVGLTTAVSAPVAPGTYFIRVRASSACGQGAVSNEASIAVP